MTTRILRMSEVKARTGLSRSSIYEFEKRGEFPHRVRLSARAVGWIEADIEDWLATRSTVTAA